LAELDQEWEVAQGEEETEGHGHRTRFLVLGVVVVLAFGYMIYAAFPGNALYFLTVSEFINEKDVQDGRTVRVSGKLVDGSFQREGNSTLSHFQLQDKETGLAREQLLNASYVGVVPDLFFNLHSEVILEGSYGPDQVFQADAILVKCPSKYQSLQKDLGDTS
jgi:cytochrome c-type biogenesis protein CcmE